MKKAFITGSLFWFVLFAAGPLMAKANDGKPASTDSLPVQPKSTATPATNRTPAIAGTPATDSIKAVPRARNQAAPTAINTQIKPIKTIKPVIKPIIKPVIKVLH